MKLELTLEQMAAGKTILMPKKRLEHWLKALRTGRYIQATGALYDPKTQGFCCLGVEQHINCRGSVEWDDGAYKGLPTDKYLEKHGILFLDADMEPGTDPFLPRLGTYASNANDGGKTFETIATAIEAAAVGY